MFLNLLLKDARRTRRNPWPILIFLAIPMCLTGLIGVAFGPDSEASGLGQIKLAVVDEDNSLVGGFLRSVFNQGEAREHFAPRILPRIEAERLIQENKISAMVVIPAQFTRAFLRGESPPPLELVKNPAQSFHPAIVEELVGVLAEGMSAVSGVLGGELQEARELVEDGEGFDFRAMGNLMTRAGDRIEGAKDFLFPPLISYETTVGDDEGPPGAGVDAAPDAVNNRNREESPRAQIFGFVLPGMAALFLLLIGDGSTRDLYKECRFGTLNRYLTLRPGLFPLLLAKITNSLWVMLLSGAILFGGGRAIFGIQWKHPLWLAGLVLAFSICACGLMALLAALARSEKRADLMNSLFVFGIAFVGGSMVPVNVLPGFVQRYLCPAAPNYWFIESIRRLQSDTVDAMVINSCLGLAVAGLGLAALSAWRFNQVLRKGVRE